MTLIVSKAPSGTRLVERLRRYDFELVAPTRRLTEQATVREIRRFRAEVYRDFGSLPEHMETTMTVDNDVDREAWHIVARSERRLVACPSARRRVQSLLMWRDHLQAIGFVRELDSQGRSELTTESCHRSQELGQQSVPG